MTAHMTARLIKLLRPLVVVVAAGLPAGVAAAETLTVEQRSVADEKAVFATVESISVVPARGRIGGTVVQLGVREGDRVTRGQAIASIGDEKLGLQMKALDAQIEALQGGGRHEEAVRVLQERIGQWPEVPRLWQLLAQSQEKLGRRADARRSMATFYELTGALPAAVEQLQQARAMSRDFYEQSQLDVRIRQLRERLESDRALLERFKS